MPTRAVGVVCARDALAVAFTPEEIWERVNRFVTLSEEDARAQFRLGPDARDWKVSFAQADLRAQPLDRSRVLPILYRPFDRRFTYYTGTTRGFIGQPAKEVMRHLLSGRNLALATTRTVEIGRGWEHVFCTQTLMQLHAVSIKETNYVFPLHLIGPEAGDVLSDENLSERTRNWLTQMGLDESSGAEKAEAAFRYVYAVLHSPAYRRRYAEFLRGDFPRIPLTSDGELFRELCRLGRRLVTLHLMEADDLAPITAYPVPGDNRVEKVRYSEPGESAERGRVWTNATQYFEGVPPEVWEFHVGGTQVCAKWLKDRKGRLLTYDDLTHHQYVVAALAQTIALMREIDAVIEAHGGWPLG
jgi:predicted helicase